MGIKLTLEQCRRQGDVTLRIWCMNHGGWQSGCHHSAEISLLYAITLWGANVRLDDLPLYCSACGSREVNVRASHEVNTGGFYW